MRGQKVMNRLVLVLLAALLFVAVNVLATTLLPGSRLDLTADRLYSLSAGTGKILGRLDEPVTLRFYFSDKAATAYPSLKTYGARVKNLLQEYQGLAKGKVKLIVTDPEAFSPAEDDAVAAGLKGVAGAGGETLYFGLVGTGSTDTQQVIPYFAPEREQYLEYDLTKLVSDLANLKKRVLGLVTTMPLEYGPGGPMAAAQGRSAPYVIYEQLRQSYEVRNLGPVFERIDPAIDLLLIAHPGDLGDQELYAIDQFVLGGGRALVLVDPLFEQAASMQQMAQMMPDGGVPQASTLAKLFAAWGLAFDDSKVVVDRGLAQRVSMAGMDGRRVEKDYVPWLALDRTAIARKDLVTADLDAVNLASAGALAPVKGASTSFEPLLTSSADSMLMEASELRVNQDPDDLLRRFKPDGRVKTLAARLTGPAKSAFPAPARAAGHLAQAKTGINVIVIADADFLDDQFWVQTQNFLGQRVAIPIADNGTLVINAVDNLSGSSDLISLRSRGVSQRPFTRVDDIRRAAETRFRAEEERLQSKVTNTEKQIRALEEGAVAGPRSQAALDRSQAAAIETFRQDLLATRKALRDVQHSLRKDIEDLGARLKLINIALVPALVAALAFMVAWIRRRRRRGPGRGPA